MNDNYLKAMKDFISQMKLDENDQKSQEAARQYVQHIYELKAKELGVSVEYYIQEFL